MKHFFMEYEMCALIREFRFERKLSQKVLYQGLCGKKTYYQTECSDSTIDQLLFERLLSRMHVQYRLFDIMLEDEEFDRLEKRCRVERCIRGKQWEQAKRLLKEYEQQMPRETVHRQYVLMQRAELLFQTGQPAGKKFQEALELTMPVPELEKRLQSNGVLAEEELWMYFRYRCCEKEMLEEEFQKLLDVMEQFFLAYQIFPPVYFETAYWYARKLWDKHEYALCRKICKQAVNRLAEGRKFLRLPELVFLDAIAGMQLLYDGKKERELFQSCKQAYYISLSLCEPELAKKMAQYCEEEFGWHIIEQAR